MFYIVSDCCIIYGKEKRVFYLYVDYHDQDTNEINYKHRIIPNKYNACKMNKNSQKNKTIIIIIHSSVDTIIYTRFSLISLQRFDRNVY